MTYNLVAFVALSGLTLLLLPVFFKRPIPLAPRILLLAAALRVIGSAVRYEVIFRFYGGLGDAVAYFDDGLDLARRLWRFDLSPLSLGQWFGGGRWWGTPFMENLSGLAVAVVGPSIRAEFLVFSLTAFVGIFLIALAFHRSMSEPAAVRFASWCFLWPSLWFWPSSVGKEAMTLLALGIATLGYVGRGKGVNWIMFSVALVLAFAIRPHVAVVLAFAGLIAQWVGSWEQLNVRRVLEGLFLVFVFLLVLVAMSDVFGGEDQSLLEYWRFWSGQTLTGGSNIGAVPVGILGSPVAFINIWMRPFLWEAGNLTTVFSAAEVALLWWLVWRNRRGLLVALKNWRESRLLRFALPLLLSYTLLIGFTFGNLGIIARQRTPVFPFFLMLLTCVPAADLHRSNKLWG